MKIQQLHQHFLTSSGICTDTRIISKKCLFFALKGEKFNGNKFAQQALELGAYRVIVDEKKYQTEGTILVNNVLETLQELALFHRNYLQIPIIALTGSNGKTTTKELINSVLSLKFNTVATKGNLNNHIGVPLTLLSMNKQTEMGIVEMGANHPKEIKQLCQITKPDYGYITNFGKAHLEGFGNLEGVVKAKTELYDFLRKNNKHVFVNAYDYRQVKKTAGIQQTTFGDAQQDCTIQLKDASKNVVVLYKELLIKSNLIGNYNFDNIAAAIAIGDYFKVSKEKIKQAIETYIPTNNRSQILLKGTNKIILDAYNANPTSMLAALENFNLAEGNTKIIFLGDMFELGNKAKIEHQKIVNYIEKCDFDYACLIGENFYKTKSNSRNIIKYKTFEELKSELNINPPVHSHLLIKASRGMALERIIDCILE